MSPPFATAAQAYGVAYGQVGGLSLICQRPPPALFLKFPEKGTEEEDVGGRIYFHIDRPDINLDSFFLFCYDVQFTFGVHSRCSKFLIFITIFKDANNDICVTRPSIAPT